MLNQANQTEYFLASTISMDKKGLHIFPSVDVQLTGAENYTA